MLASSAPLTGEGANDAIKRRIHVLREVSEDIVWKMWKGGLDFREADRFARDLARAKGEIAALERQLHDCRGW